MARIPVAAELERSSIDVTTSIVGYQAGIKEGASAELADTTGAVTSKVGRMAQYYLNQQNKKDAKAALLNLKEKSLGIETQISGVKGNDAYNPKTLKGYEDSFNIERDKFGQGLNASSKEMYLEKSRELGMGINVAATRHGMVEEEHMNKFIYDKSTSVAAQTAAQNWDVLDANGNYASVNEQREFLREETEAFFTSQGITDPKFLEAEFQTRVSAMHLAVVDSMVEDKQMGKAKEYMAEYTKVEEITEADRKKMNDRIDPAVSYEKGFNIGIGGFDDVRGGKSRTEVILDMKIAAGDDKEVYTAAIQTYDRLNKEFDEENGEVVAEIVADHEQGGLGIAHPKMAELKNRSIKDYYTAVHQINQETNRKANKPAPRGTSQQADQYYALLGAGMFDGKEGAANAKKMQATLGREYYDKAIAYNGVLAKNTAIATKKGLADYSISARRIGLAFPLDATTPDKTKIKGLVETELREHIERTGNLPTPEDEDKIMLAQRENYTVGNDEWTFWRDGTEEMVKYKLEIGQEAWPTGLDDLMNDGYTPEEKFEVWNYIQQKRNEFPEENIDYDKGFMMYKEDKSK